MAEHLLSVKNLRTSFFTPAGEVKAVNDVSFNLDKGKVLGIVGESGSGKSVTAYSIMRILSSNGKIVGGNIFFNGKDLTTISENEMRAIRGNKISM
ncbi:MAG TPA: ATP-binding cassette domain-containing protein, partial [Clostridia bacterium]